MVLVVVVIAATFLAGCDWTSVQFGPAQTNYNPYEPALTEASVQHLIGVWSTPCTCAGGARVAGGLVYIVDGYTGTLPFTMTLRALDAATGAGKWSASLGQVDGATAAVIANGLVYVHIIPHSGSHRLVAFDATTGAYRWQVTPSVPGPSVSDVTMGEPVVDGGLAFVRAFSGSADEVVAAIDSSGKVVWTAAPGGGGIDLALDPDHHTVYAKSEIFLNGGGHVVLLTGYAEANGAERSKVFAKVDARLGIAGIAFSNALVIGTLSDPNAHTGAGAVALRPDTGEIAWSGANGSVVAITPDVTLEDGTLHGGRLTAYDTTTGAVRWQLTTGFEPVRAAAGGLTYGFQAMGTAANDLSIRRLTDGAVVASVPANIGDLTPSGGRVYDVNTAVQAFAPSQGS